MKEIYQNTVKYYDHIEKVSKDFFNDHKELINESLEDGEELTNALSNEIHEYSAQCADNEIIYYYDSFKICELFEHDYGSNYFDNAESEVDFSEYNSLRDIRQAIAYYICFNLFYEEISEKLEAMEKDHFEKEYHKTEGQLTA
jgi:hypothetical protein